MARSIDHHSVSGYPADQVYATLVDPEYLRARLEKLGGRGAELIEHRADADGARYRLRHGLAAEDLPSMVRNLLPGDIVIERTETLRRAGAGRYAGTVDVVIHGTPASAEGRMRLADQDGTGGSEFTVHADVTVKVPLLGGRIEGVVAGQVRNLLAAETAFTLDWLARH
jgi:hypothetical protein